VHLQPWPSRPAPSNPPGAAPRRGAARVVQIAVQVDGKLRAVVEVPGESTADAIEGAARASGTVAARLEGRRVERVIHVDGRAVNFVTSPG
jgi:leucyl-tRNA synthetase